MAMHLINTCHTVKKSERGTQVLPKTASKRASDVAYSEKKYSQWKKRMGIA